MKTLLVRSLSVLLAISMAVTMAQDANARGMSGFKVHSYSIHIGHLKRFK